MLTSGMAVAAPTLYAAVGGTATFDHRVLFVNVRGNVPDVTSEVMLDLDNLAATTGTVTVPIIKLNTGIALRDNDARSEKALNTAKYPDITFTLTQLTGGRLFEGLTVNTTATGDLSLKGTTRSISVPVKASLSGGVVKVSTQFKFNPHDYSVNYPYSSNVVTVNVTFNLVVKNDIH